MKDGDWSPAVFSDCTVADQFSALNLYGSSLMRRNLIGENRARGGGGQLQRPPESRTRWYVTYQHVLLGSKR